MKHVIKNIFKTLWMMPIKLTHVDILFPNVAFR